MRTTAAIVRGMNGRKRGNSSSALFPAGRTEMRFLPSIRDLWRTCARARARERERENTRRDQAPHLPRMQTQRIHSVDEVASRFENFQDERLREIAHTRLANFSIASRADRINKARRGATPSRVSRLISCRIELDFQLETGTYNCERVTREQGYTHKRTERGRGAWTRVPLMCALRVRSAATLFQRARRTLLHRC